MTQITGMEYFNGTYEYDGSPLFVRIAAVPPFPSIPWFHEGCNFHKWTGDDSKALMKVSSQLMVIISVLFTSDNCGFIQVYLTSITGYVPGDMVRCLAAFLDFCYLV